MDSSIQIQGIKSQIENLKLQIDNIEMQNNNNMGMMGMIDNNKIGEQLINLSIQMFNVGIQAFNTGNNNFEIVNLDKFHNQLKNISEKIKEFASYSDPNPMMQQMMQNQMMQLEMMQQQAMMQQMMQEQMMSQQAMTNQNRKVKYLNFIFKKSDGNTITITIENNKKIKDLFDKYISEAYGLHSFICNAKKISRHDQRIIGDYFTSADTYIISVE